jgi:N-acetylmuramoyl-L-alanine amidase
MPTENLKLKRRRRLKRNQTAMFYQTFVCLLSIVLLGATVSGEALAKDFKVAIDIGHSATVPGAISARGVPEYNFNRRIATLLLAKLRQDPNFRSSFIINEEGDKISLSSRPALAQTRGAEIFISIHHDSVYTDQLSKWVYQGKLLDVCDEYAGYSVFYSESNGSPADSRRLADSIGAEMRRGGFVPNLNHAGRGNRVLMDRTKGVYSFNGLAVLKNADIPAVLMECGVIKNSLEEVKLCDPRQQQRLVEALYKAVVRYAGVGR